MLGDDWADAFKASGWSPAAGDAGGTSTRFEIPPPSTPPSSSSSSSTGGIGDDWAAAFKATGWSPTSAPTPAGPAQASAPPPRAATGGGTSPHWGLATRAAQKYGLDPSLLAAVWDFESSNNPGAINKSSGATGLGQVMPREAGFRDRPTQQELLNPETNAEWSARILKSGLDRYGSEDKALAAYLGAIDARGNITGAVDANGTGGNQYIRTVRERQQKYGGAVPAAASSAPASSGDAAQDWAAPFRKLGWSPGASGAAGGGPPGAGAEGGPGSPVAGNVITKAGQNYWSFGGGPHAGVDISAKAGTPVRTPVAGEVVANLAAGQNPLGLSAGYGRAVAVRDAQGDVHIFGHGAPDFAYLPVGTKVGVGQVVSQVGSPKTKLAGEATEGEHLHWEIRGGGDYGKQIDPEGWLSGRGLPATNDPRQALSNPTAGRMGSVGGIDLGDWASAFKRTGWTP